jgi:NAD(P)H-hydrate epimerase
MTLSRRGIPALTGEQMREVDRTMVEDLHIQLVQMMENAGRNLAELAMTRFEPTSVSVLAGPGGNGGGGLVARHLANRGCDVHVVLADPERLGTVPAHQADIGRRIGLAFAERPFQADLVIDALLGYSLHGSPTGAPATLIAWANDQAAPILALDTPSGLDVTTGAAFPPTLRATATLTLALPKTGLLEAPEVGELFLADIGVPPLVYRRLGIVPPSPLFGESSVLRLDP